LEIALIMMTDRSTSLNFLIYLQNIYINQTNNTEKIKFPYFSAKITFKDNFKSRFQNLWKKVSQIVFLNDVNDTKLFYEEKEIFYHSLFCEDAEGLTSFHEVYKSFQAWWGDFTGGFVIERSIDEAGYNLYLDLVGYYKESGIKVQKDIYISLIYDECLLANTQTSSDFAVIPIKDYFINYDELVKRLKNNFL